jgi:secondary thiamine-phosphate synthase enzyme
MPTFSITTRTRDQLLDITDPVQDYVTQAKMLTGCVIVYVPHTTAGITINENADPDVIHDLLAQLDAMVPWRQPFYEHNEGNSAAHVKASLVGSSVTIPVENGRLTLGQWQGVYFCEFDGPRTRQVRVTLLTM